MQKPYSIIRGMTLEQLQEELQRLVNSWDGSSQWTVEYRDGRWHATKVDANGFEFNLRPLPYAEHAVVEWCHKLGAMYGITEGPSPLKGVV